MKRSVAIAAALLLTTAASAMAAPSSGMLLGIYAFPNQMGLRVTRTMPGYSAHGTLFRNDVLTRVTADGNQVYTTRNTRELEFVKDQIGPNRPAALEVFRPGQGYIYLWVEFIPVGGTIGYSAAKSTVKANIMTERQKPGARNLFKSSSNNRPGNSPRPRPGNSNNASRLFGR